MFKRDYFLINSGDGMKLNYTTKNNRLIVQIEAGEVKEAFKQLSEIQEVFDEPFCGSCNSANIKYQVRNVDGNEFYEIKCLDCLSRLSFGQHKKGGTLFPKRKNEDGSFDVKNKGWVKWNGENN